MNTTHIDIWLTEWSATWGTHDLPGRIRIEPGPRLRRSLGRCQPASGRVHIHTALFEPENAELLREVVCHEAAHVAVHLLHGRKARAHGPEWKCLVAAAGYPPTTRMDPRRLPERLQTTLQHKTLYRHSCLVCGAMRMARRRVGNWRCGACREAGLEGRLEIVPVRGQV